jgi:phosphatidylglycerophosphate synthase
MGEAGERRPIKAREFGVSQAFAHWLAVHGAGANAISMIGLAAALCAGAAFGMATDDSPWLWLMGAALVETRLLCNMFDGMVAIERGTASRLGEIFNEVPDRIADIAVLVGLGHAPGSDASLGYMAALAAVLTAYVRAFGTSIGQPADFGGPMAKPHRMQAVALIAIVIAVAGPAALPAHGILWGLGLPAWGLAIIAAGSGVTAGLRLARLMAALQ